MDIVQFLLAVVNLLLALVVLFGGKLIFQRLTELQEEVDDLKTHRSGPSSEEIEDLPPPRSAAWKE